FYLAKVSPKLEKPENVAANENKVRLVFQIDEGEQVRIRKIEFIGNKVYTDTDIKKIMQSTEGGFFSAGFSSEAANFNEGAFRDDLERIKWLYANDGYVRFEYDQPVVTLSEDLRWVYITINVREGSQYTTGSVTFEGDDLFTEEQLKEKINL